MFTQTVSFSAAFLAGLLSFLSPCVLPLIPAYFTFITGFSIEQLTEGEAPGMRRKVILSTLSFVCGFTLLFILLGASASFLTAFILRFRDYIEILVGIVVLIFGLHLLGWLPIAWLKTDKHLHVQKRPLHLFGVFLVGMAFGAGWSSCTGPLLGAILAMAASKETVGQGMALLAVYAAGLALPFVIISVFIDFLLIFIRRATRLMPYINGIAGALLIAVGIFLLTRNLVTLMFNHT
jgi:cytochrome c-type biogenesis protein